MRSTPARLQRKRCQAAPPAGSAALLASAWLGIAATGHVDMTDTRGMAPWAACALGHGAEGEIGAVAGYLAAVAPCPDVGAGIETNSDENRLETLVMTSYDEYHSCVVDELMEDQ